MVRFAVMMLKCLIILMAGNPQPHFHKRRVSKHPSTILIINRNNFILSLKWHPTCTDLFCPCQSGNALPDHLFTFPGCVTSWMTQIRPLLVSLLDYIWGSNIPAWRIKSKCLLLVQKPFWSITRYSPVCYSLLRDLQQYGRYATPEEIAESGDSTCSICQDKMSFPVILFCKHVFCEECISEW